MTVILLDVADNPVALAVMVAVPPVLRVMEKVPVPETRDAGEGRTAAPSELLIETRDEKPVAMFPLASLAVIEKLNEVPETVEAGIDPNTSTLAAPGVILKEELIAEVRPVELAERV